MSNDISNSDDTLDSRDVIARLEELEEQKHNWVAGWNMPGFLPEAQPAGFSDCDDARKYIARQMRDYAESLDGDEYKERADALREEAKGLEQSAESEPESEYGETVGGYHYWIERAENNAFEDTDDADEYRALKALADEAKDSPDWQYGGTLIRDSYFEEYAQELATDIGAISGKENWPLTCIDWERAARELQQDYMSVNFDGVTYWIRA